MKDFFKFRKMISSLLVQVLYVIGATLITFLSLYMMSTASQLADFSTPPNMVIFYSFIILIVGNLFWRLICESLIILFSMHDRMVEATESIKLLKPHQQENASSE